MNRQTCDGPTDIDEIRQTERHEPDRPVIDEQTSNRYGQTDLRQTDMIQTHDRQTERNEIGTDIWIRRHEIESLSDGQIDTGQRDRWRDRQRDRQTGDRQINGQTVRWRDRQTGDTLTDRQTDMRQTDGERQM